MKLKCLFTLISLDQEVFHVNFNKITFSMFLSLWRRNGRKILNWGENANAGIRLLIHELNCKSVE